MPDALNVLVKDKKTEKGDNENEEKEDTKEEDNYSSATILFIFLMALILLIGSMNDEFKHKGREATKTTLMGDWARIRSVKPKLFEAQLYTPEQLHLSLGVDDKEVYVTWVTMDSANCQLAYGTINHLNQIRNQNFVQAKLTRTKSHETDPKWIKVSHKSTRAIYTYRAKITNLVPGKYYAYRAECSKYIHSKDNRYTSALYTFSAKEFSKTSEKFDIAFYGDLGFDNARAVSHLIKAIDEDSFDMVIHNGDFAYDLDSKNGLVGDQFMRLIEPIAARVPYQTSVGNHEIAENFTHYNSRFTMIDQGKSNYGRQNNFYYSFNVGSVHFIAFSTEFYYFADYVGIKSLQLQYEWLKQDLAHASSPTERANRPWIVVFGHRPMYCSSDDKDDCTRDTNILRKGLTSEHNYALEKLFYDYGVDVQLYSHEHQYERFLPIYNGTVMAGDDKNNPYDNPKGPVHIISGSAGCNELIDGFKSKPINGSAVRVAEYGTTKLTTSRCKLEFEQISYGSDIHVSDRFTVTKSRLSNFPMVSDIDLNCN